MTTIGNRNLSIKDFYNVLYNRQKISFHEQALENVSASYEFLVDFNKDKLIYGINTGFGPMAQYRISDDEQHQLQYNLIRSHSAGLGKVMDLVFIKSLMIARLNTLLKGYSGVHPDVVELLKELINKDIIPIVYEHGSVGASGDLVQLAHLALTLIGEGKVYYKDKITDTEDAFAENGLQPLSIRIREGLALINGTSAMTGVGIVNTIQARNLVNWSIMISSMMIEMVESYDDHFSSELNQTKQHTGQQYIAGRMRNILKDSLLIKKRDAHLYSRKVTEKVLTEKVQEYYSIRCIPQILGPVYDTLSQVIDVVTNEVNSVNDNPVIDANRQNVYHGGNFHGDYVSLAMDQLKIAVIRLSMLAERQLNFLLNHNINQILPPFVNLGTLGLNLGMQGAQFVATSTTAESQTLAFPMYVHSIPNNNDNQDIVSMGTNAALLTSKVIDNTYQVLAVQLLTLIQAIDHLQINHKLSSFGQRVYQEVRELIPVFTQDSIMHLKLEKVEAYLRGNHIDLDAYEENVDAMTDLSFAELNTYRCAL